MDGWWWQWGSPQFFSLACDHCSTKEISCRTLSPFSLKEKNGLTHWMGPCVFCNLFLLAMRKLKQNRSTESTKIKNKKVNRCMPGMLFKNTLNLPTTDNMQKFFSFSSDTSFNYCFHLMQKIQFHGCTNRRTQFFQ